MSTSGDRTQAMEERQSRLFLLLIYANAFIVGGVVMGFEMLGSRYLNPFFGSGIYTWAALISTVLASLTAGYFFGGWMADRKPTPAGLGWLIVAGSAYLAIIPLFADDMLELLTAALGSIEDQREFERWGSIAGAMLLLFVPLGLLGVYSPYAIRLTLRATTRSGTVAGRIYGISTMGSIFGTLFATFYLIPAMGSRHITFLLAAIGAASGLSFLLIRRDAIRRLVPAAAAVLLAVALLPQGASADDGRERIVRVQAAPDAKEAAESFLDYLRKQGVTVSHGGIEAAQPQGFRIKTMTFTTPDRAQWKVGTFEAATFALQPNGEATLTAPVLDSAKITNANRSVVKIARASAETLTWVAQRSVSARGLSLRDVTISEASGQSVKLATATLASARLDGPTGGAVEKLALRGVTMSGPEANGSIGSIDLESITAAVPQNFTLKGFALRDLVVEAPGQGTVKLQAFELRGVEASDVMDRNPANIRLFDLGIRGLEVPLALGSDPTFTAQMKALGYEALKFSGELLYRYEAAEKAYNLARLEFDFDDMTRLRLALKIAGLAPDEIRKMLQPPAQPGQPGQPPGEPNPAAAMGILAQLNLVSADISILDKSLLGRVVTMEAQRQKTDEASVRAQYKALLTGFRDQQTDALMKEAIDAVIAFIDNPGELVVEVRPPAPANLIAIGSMGATNPAALRGMIGLKIVAKPKQ